MIHFTISTKNIIKKLTLFNQSLELFDKFGSSDAGDVLHLISNEQNDLKIKKDRFYRFKKEWRINFYVVIFMCLSIPIILKLSMSDIYNAYMNSFGLITMVSIIIVNLFIINKIENIYNDLSIGEEAHKVMLEKIKIFFIEEDLEVLLGWLGINYKKAIKNRIKNSVFIFIFILIVSLLFKKIYLFALAFVAALLYYKLQYYMTKNKKRN